MKKEKQAIKKSKVLLSDNHRKIGSVMVIGGGIAGIQSALDLANSGYKVYLVEKSPSIGGTMAQLDKTFPTNDCAMCILAPKLVEAGRHPNIELITYAELKEVRGKAGNFKVKIRKKARSIDADACTGCGSCTANCPVTNQIYIPDKERRENGFKGASRNIKETTSA